MSDKQIPLPGGAERARCMEIRKRSKRGEYISPDESAFCRKILDGYPEWYTRTQTRVFNETVPFGSQRRLEE